MPTFELFRGDKLLEVVPFATTDVASSLDLPLPGDKHFDMAFARPSTFDFPASTVYGGHAAADADPSVFRLRLKDPPGGFTAETVEVTLKVTSPDDVQLQGTATAQKYLLTAVNQNGMKVSLRKNGRVWESPYLRVATSVSDLSKPAAGPGSTSAIVHSPAPAFATTADRTLAQGKQYGRKLTATCAMGSATVTGKFTLGGTPHARIPVRFLLVAEDVTTPKLASLSRNAHDSIALANAYWAGQGLEFETGATSPMQHVQPPARNLLVVGEHTGRAQVSDHDFQLTINLSLKRGTHTHPTASATARITANSAPGVVAEAIRTAIASIDLRSVPEFADVRLGADTFEFAAPRVVVVSLDATGASHPLGVIGTRGPVDITIKQTEGFRDDVEDVIVTVTGLVTANVPPGKFVDIFCPPVGLPIHDPSLNPPSAVQRHWIRSFADPTGDSITAVASLRAHLSSHSFASLNQAGMSTLYDANETTLKGRIDANMRELGSSESPISMLNFGRWTEPCARFTVFLPEASLGNKNDVPHEFGHTLADVNHCPLTVPWFYDNELMHSGGPAYNFAVKMTRHPIKADAVRDESGMKAVFIDLPNGYGGAVRARIASLNPRGWLLTDPHFPFGEARYKVQLRNKSGGRDNLRVKFNLRHAAGNEITELTTDADGVGHFTVARVERWSIAVGRNFGHVPIRPGVEADLSETQAFTITRAD